MTKDSLRTLLAGVCLASGLAYGDTSPPLYVDATGSDTGDCTSREAPCQSIGYALNVAGKNANIRVAPGRYRLGNPDDLIYMVSGAVNVTGSYQVTDDAHADRRSLVSGVPLEYRELLRERGFDVIVDEKGANPEFEAQALQNLKTYQRAEKSTVATPCTAGTSAGFACSQVDLLSHTARLDISAAPNAVADIWGFVDLNTRREYAIVGVSIGTAVFDVTDPENPVEIGFVNGQATTWRDIKVYQFFDGTQNRWRAYAYVTTDGATDGLFVLDLGGLPHSFARVPYTSDFSRAHNVYLTDADYGTGLSLNGSPQLIIAGSGEDAGQFRTYSLANPAAPSFVQRVSGAGYMHDATSLRIDDARTAQCVNAGSACDVLVDFNEENVEVWDVTNASSPSQLAQVPQYTNTEYVHSGWWTEDRQFVLAHDELDESRRSLNSTVRVFSLANLASPALVETWTGPTRAIDHNGFVRGNRYYMSNYTRGLTILDLTDPTSLNDIGFFDTFSANNNVGFSGAWGAYPYFHSGTIAVSDINSGLYLLKDQTRDVSQGQLQFDQASFGVSEAQQAQLSVSRVGGSTGAISVDYEVVPGTATVADYQAVSGSLTWADGETASRTILIDATADAANEDLELALVRLVNPQGGATLADANVASLYIGEAGAPGEIRLFEDSVDIPERGFGKAVVVVQRDGSASGPASIDFAVAGGDAVINSDFTGTGTGTINWADGDADPKFLEFAIVDDNVAEPDEFFDITFSNATGANIVGSATARVLIRDGSSGANAPPNAVAGAGQTVQEGSQVSLNGSASNDPDGDNLTFMWAQTSGSPNVVLNNPTSATASFTAPNVSSDALLTFQLTVTDPGGLMSSATTNVTITNAVTTNPPAPNRGGGGIPSPLLLISLALLGLVSRVSRKDFA